MNYTSVHYRDAGEGIETREGTPTVGGTSLSRYGPGDTVGRGPLRRNFVISAARRQRCPLSLAMHRARGEPSAIRDRRALALRGRGRFRRTREIAWGTLGDSRSPGFPARYGEKGRLSLRGRTRGQAPKNRDREGEPTKNRDQEGEPQEKNS